MRPSILVPIAALAVALTASASAQDLGTHLDYDKDGCPSLEPADGPDGISAQRAAAGLEPISEHPAFAATYLGRTDQCAGADSMPDRAGPSSVPPTPDRNRCP